MKEVRKDIFKNAYFGKLYKTRDGRKAIYIGGHRCVIENNNNCFFSFRSNGMHEGYATGTDIVSDWQEEINEEELDKLAEELNPNDPHGDTYEVGQYFGFDDGFKAGYLKAKEEKNER